MQTWNVLDTPEVMCMPPSKLPGGKRDMVKEGVWDKKKTEERSRVG